MTIDDDIEFKRRSLNDQLETLRSSTMKFGKITGAGVFEVSDPEKLGLLNAEIAAVEAKASRLEEIANSFNEAYAEAGVKNFTGLQQQVQDNHDIIQGAPIKAWGQFKLTRGEGASEPSRLRTNWFVSDICNEPGYKSIEDKLRAEKEAAQAANAALKPTWDALMILTREVAAL